MNTSWNLYVLIANWVVAVSKLGCDLDNFGLWVSANQVWTCSHHPSFPQQIGYGLAPITPPSLPQVIFRHIGIWHIVCPRVIDYQGNGPYVITKVLWCDEFSLGVSIIPFYLFIWYVSYSIRWVWINIFFLNLFDMDKSKKNFVK
jgi:hypothetical protein